MKKTIAILISVMLIIGVCFVGCGKANLKGTWAQSVNGVELYGFTFTDTTVEMTMTGVSAGVYEYTVVDDDTIEVTANGSTSEWTYSLSGNKLSLTISSVGSAIELTRK